MEPVTLHHARGPTDPAAPGGGGASCIIHQAGTYATDTERQPALIPALRIPNAAHSRPSQQTRSSLSGEGVRMASSGRTGRGGGKGGGVGFDPGPSAAVKMRSFIFHGAEKALRLRRPAQGVKASARGSLCGYA